MFLLEHKHKIKMYLISNRKEGMDRKRERERFIGLN